MGHRIDSLDPVDGFDPGPQYTEGAQRLRRVNPIRELNMQERYLVIAKALLEFAVLRQRRVGIEKPDAHAIVGYQGGFHPW
jgi:hypothetical protein